MSNVRFNRPMSKKAIPRHLDAPRLDADQLLEVCCSDIKYTVKIRLTQIVCIF